MNYKYIFHFHMLVNFLLLFMTFQADLTPDQLEKIRSQSKICISKTGVDKEKVKRMKDGIFADDDKLQEFLLCLMKHFGVFKADGNINVDLLASKLSSNLSQNERDDIVNNCFSIRADTDKETVFLLYKCYREKVGDKRIEFV